MSEKFAEHRYAVERLSRHIKFRFDSVAWAYDGNECPSYI